MRLVLLGKPGSGKGTQAVRICDAEGIPKISTGDLIRDAIARGTELGRRFQGYSDRGLLVPDTLVWELVEERLGRPDTISGFLLDGFPRTEPQAEALDKWLEGAGVPLDAAVYLRVPDDALVGRAIGRRFCPEDGSTYHLEFAAPKVPGRCDVCGAALEQRADDTEEVVRARLAEYEEKTAPLVSFYAAQGLLSEVDGVGSLEDVATRVDQARGASRAASQAC